MIDYNNIEKGRIITGINLDGEEVTGVCTNVMNGFRMVSVTHGEDRLDKSIIEFLNISEIKDAE